MGKLFHLACVSSATVGNGTITLGPAVPPYRTFAAAGAVDGDYVSYGIRDGVNSEVGNGFIGGSVTTLTREVISSTNSNNTISLSGNAQIYATPNVTDLDGEHVNVKDFGAKGDLTVDDTNAIQAAIDYAIANGFREVFIPSGRYKTTKPIFVDPPNNLRGLSTYSEWAVGTTYAIGDVRLHNGRPWKSLANGNVGNEPVLSAGNFTAGGDWSSADHGPATGEFIYWEPTTKPPDMFSMNLSLVGPPGQAGGSGPAIYTNFNNDVGIWMGPGNSMLLASVGIYAGAAAANDATDGGTVNSNVYSGAYRWGRGLPTSRQTPASPTNSSPGSVGIAIAGTGGGTRMFIDRCMIQGFSTAIQTGCSGDGLGDFNIIKDPMIFNAAAGFVVSQTQNFINRIENGHISARVDVINLVGTNVICDGGNYSTMWEQVPSCSFALSSITAIDDLHFSAVLGVSNPTTLEVGCGNLPLLDYVKTGQLTIYIAETENFGLVPFHPDSFDVSTSTMTFKIDDDWCSGNRSGAGYYNIHLGSTFSLMDDIAALTKIYAAEEVFTFYGNGIYASGMHVENAAPTRFFDTASGFGMNLPSSARAIYFNGPLGYINGRGSEKDKALWNAQAVISFIRISQGSLEMEDCGMGSTGNVRLNLDQIGSLYDFKMSNCKGFQFNTHSVGLDYSTVSDPTIGCGRFDMTAYPGIVLIGTGIPNYRGSFWGLRGGQCSYWGFRPAPWTRPAIRNDFLDYLMAPATPVRTAGWWNNVYLPLWGGQIYTIDNVTPASSFPSHRQVVSDHKGGYSYGADLNVAWTAKGMSAMLYVDDISLLFPGLSVVLTTGGDPNNYIITGVVAYMDKSYPTDTGQPGYCTLKRPDGNWNQPAFWGVDKDTIYNGSTLGQEPFNIKFFDHNLSMLDVATIAVGSLPSAAANKGVRRMVNDANAATYWSIVAAGGAITVPVISDGTNWRIGS